MTTSYKIHVAQDSSYPRMERVNVAAGDWDTGRDWDEGFTTSEEQDIAAAAARARDEGRLAAGYYRAVLTVAEEVVYEEDFII